MLDFGFYNMDCMEGMKQFPDKYFDLAIVDPPYGDALQNRGGGGVDSVNGSTGTKLHQQQKNCRKTDGTWGYPNWWNMGEEVLGQQCGVTLRTFDVMSQEVWGERADDCPLFELKDWREA